MTDAQVTCTGDEKCPDLTHLHGYAQEVYRQDEPLPLQWSYSSAQWLAEVGSALADEVDRLWPQENDPGYRAACLAEEAGEVIRAITKRRHALHADDGKCKGLDFDEWTNELRIELGQVLGVILDIAHREGFDLTAELVTTVRKLQAREVGT